MSNTTISINPDDAAHAVNLIAKNQQDTVEVRSQLTAQGVAVGAAHNFKYNLDSYVTDVRATMSKIQKQLLVLHENVTTTVVELGEQDAALASQTQTFLSGVNEIAAPAAVSANGAAPMADNSAAKTIG